MENTKKPKARLLMSKKHAQVCHERWLASRNRKYELSEFPDSWYGEQCGACRYFVPLAGALIEDWGVCTNPDALFDGRVRFEHDGCDHFDEASDGWKSLPPSAIGKDRK